MQSAPNNAAAPHTKAKMSLFRLNNFVVSGNVGFLCVIVIPEVSPAIGACVGIPGNVVLDDDDGKAVAEFVRQTHGSVDKCASF